MSIYVDILRTVPRSRKWPYNKACHLVADSVEELHYFAGRMMLNPSWFQEGVCSLPHYDLTKNRRLLAVKLGAIEIDDSRLVDMMRIRRYRQKKTGQ